MTFLLGALPTLAAACAYPAPLRSVNATLLAVLDAGGTVSIHHRNRLVRAIAGLEGEALKRTIAQEVARGDARAAGQVIDTATALAAGRGMVVDPGLRDPVSRLGASIQSQCSGTSQVASGTDAAAGAEHGDRRDVTVGGRALTFREGVARLSLTFTIYLVFLAALLGIRRHVHQRARAQQDGVAPPVAGPDEPEPLA
ncbi:hypothetical protein [uncultured Tateyamaria sp.]|uniref:hypothetical protein n=1 Tax=uncultured Tateyamaria sp. TaxID=455651 RepID=UPI002620E7B7|nr:hypothetical protein [uncultured Tateyamaria sp.]